jgi:hypothetical protein
MDLMKRLVPILIFTGALAAAADLSAVKNVYVMTMNRGLDQYLASRLTAEGIFSVVTDPKLADAVLTDRFGEVLQTQLEIISPTPKPEVEEEDAEATEKADAKPAKSSRSAKDQDNSSPISAFGASSGSDGASTQTSTFGRSKGNIFLVDTKSRQVLWSTYDPPKTTAPRDLNRTASDIVSRIRKDLNPKKK